MKNASKLFLRLALLFFLAASSFVLGQSRKVMTPNPQLYAEQDSLVGTHFFGRVVNKGYEAQENTRTFVVALLRGEDTLQTIRLAVPKSVAPDLILSVGFSFELPADRIGFRIFVDLFNEIDEEFEGDNEFSLDPSLDFDLNFAQSVSFRLEQNYPNPFNPSTKINFSLVAKDHVGLVVFNTLGQRIATLVDGVLDPGSHVVSWQPSDLPSGVYFYRLRVGIFSEVKRMTLIR